MKMEEVVIDSSWDLFEAAYPGNLGLMEMMRFHLVATDEQKAEMDKVVANKDWNRFKELIFEVLGIRLM